MKGLILKDFINLKKNAKIFSVLTLLYAFMAFTSKDTSFFSTIFSMLFAVLTLSVYSYDEIAKWDVYALTMPVTKENIVMGKYIMMLLLSLLGTFVSVIFTVILNIALGNSDVFIGINNALIGAGIVIVFYSVVLPFITKLGVEKARLILFACYIVPFGIIYFVGKAVEDGKVIIPNSLVKFMKTLIEHGNLLGPLFIIIALGISFLVSVRIYSKKEF